MEKLQEKPLSNGSYRNQPTERRKGFVDIIRAGLKVIWNKEVPGTQMEKFKAIIQNKYGVTFSSYWDLHEWSIENFPQFWEEIWKFYGVIHSQPYTKPFKKKGNGFLDVEWFSGARLNYAENILRYRDDKVALICVDEERDEKKVTFAEMFEEVKLYAAAFKKHGLQKGDRVACYIPNRREAIYAFLAATSMGAMFGGPLPFFGAKAASTIMTIIGPKFLLTVDRFQFNKEEYDVLQKLPTIVDENTCIEKVIIVPTKENSKLKDISIVRKSCFLDEFLSAGLNPNGTIPDIVFEQLPFDHPITINFTSGTTGVPKGLVHSAGVLLPGLKDWGLHDNHDRNSVIFVMHPAGWNVWNFLVGNLALGSSLLLYNGRPTFFSRPSIWDILDHYKVSFIFFNTNTVDALEKEDIVPSPGCTLEHLKIIAIGATPVKLQNVEFITQRVKPGVFVGNLYGATELLSLFSGFDFNTPMYSPEIQCPALGIDIKIFNEEGKSVIGKAGELVLATPISSLPVSVWNDVNGAKMRETYLSKFPGVWTQSDEAWIDPDTRGLIIIGRSDRTLKQESARFVSEEIYWAVHDIKEIADSICVSQSNISGDTRAVLFIKMKNGLSLDSKMVDKIKKEIKCKLDVFLVPKVILAVKDIPYNLNGKRMETVVKKIINSNTIPEVNNIRNPQCLREYWNIPEILNF